VGRVRGSVERDGLRRTVRRGVRKLVSPVVETGALVFFARELDQGMEDLPAGSRAGHGYRVREAHPSEIEAVRAASDPGRSVEILRERFRRGHQCFVAEGPGGAVGHVRWVTTDPPWVPELRRDLLLAPGDAYFYDGFTRPDARRRGLDGLTRTTIFRAMRARGCRRAVSYVRADNPAGLRAAARWQRPVGAVRWVRIGRGRPRLLGAGAVAPLGFSREPVAGTDDEDLAERARGWDEWFRGWLAQPLDRRSTGFSALPDEYFEASGRFVAETLELDPGEDSVLDVGCSSAGVGRRVARRCRDFTGVDATLGLLADAARDDVETGAGRRARFLASDGRLLPFPGGAFSAVYCTGVIHTLPSQDDGLRVVRELVRVCRPGGRVLVGALPDRARRWGARAEAWRRGSWRERAELAAAVLLPGPVKAALRRRTGRPPRHRLVALEYDLEALRSHLHDLDPALECRIVPFPPHFWSRDFRITRSNFVIDVPRRHRETSPEEEVRSAPPAGSGSTPPERRPRRRAPGGAGAPGETQAPPPTP
jgi:SAM-dependent methyltransferase